MAKADRDALQAEVDAREIRAMIADEKAGGNDQQAIRSMEMQRAYIDAAVDAFREGE